MVGTARPWASWALRASADEVVGRQGRTGAPGSHPVWLGNARASALALAALLPLNGVPGGLSEDAAPSLWPPPCP
eukprot:1142316-Alexandrium_andersonii.AAC.1